MKILIISHRLPYPPDDGGRIVTFNQLRYLAKRGHDLTFVGMATEPPSAATLTALEQYCRPIIFVKSANNPIYRLLLNLASPQPYTMEKYQHPEILQTVSELISRENFDVVMLAQLHAAWYRKGLLPKHRVPVALYQHNVEAQIMNRFAAQQKNLLVRAYARLQERKLKRYEAQCVRDVDVCITISKDDQTSLASLVPEANLHTVSPGVDLEPIWHPIETAPILISVASMEWLPNVDGIHWFCREVFPRILEAQPDTLFYIVGKNPPDDIRQLANDNIKVTGWLEDVDSLIKLARAFVVPLRIGGGMRIKILNAFSKGIPVISTSIGCEGLPVTAGQHLLIGDTPEEFADATLKLLNDPLAGQVLGIEALNLVRDHFSWAEQVRRLEAILSDTIRRTDVLSGDKIAK